ncbi:MAG: hypothetical protein IT379_01595 [Deltaproteobacteria bacterium]|nr:hypothetical protein [Deltaproteobacteria bacterium]
MCWGDNREGQLGDGTREDRDLPTPVLTDIVDWSLVSTGGMRTCATRTADRSIWCWGQPPYPDPWPETDLIPTHNVPDTPVEQVSTGSRHGCMVAYGWRMILCWGLNEHGQLGHDPLGAPGAMGVSSRPDPREVHAGIDYSCARVAAGMVHCWGSRTFLGDGTDQDSYRPVAVAGLTPVLGDVDRGLCPRSRCDRLDAWDGHIRWSCARVSSPHTSLV